MNTRLTGGAIAAALISLATSAHAVPIAAGSTLSLDGTDSYTSTSISFVNPANIGAESGSFTELANCTGCVTMTNFTTGTATPFTMYTATEGSDTTSLSVASDSFNFSAGPPSSLTVSGNGTLSLTGFDPTPGYFIVTTQGPTGVDVTFSVTSGSLDVPEPASLTLLGSALVGLGWLGRRRRKTA